MGRYSGESSVGQVITIKICSDATALLQTFEEDAKEEGLNAVLVFDKDSNVSRFTVNELSLDIKDSLKKEHVDYYLNLFKSGESVVQEDFTIEYFVDGHYTPANISGPPEHCYPEESEEERTVKDCYIEFFSNSKPNPIIIPESCFDKIYDLFEKDIYASEFTPYDDY